MNQLCHEELKSEGGFCYLIPSVRVSMLHPITIPVESEIVRSFSQFLFAYTIASFMNIPVTPQWYKDGALYAKSISVPNYPMEQHYFLY